MGFASSPPALPPVPPPPQATPAAPTQTIAEQEALAAEDAAKEMRRQAGFFGRHKTILAGGIDPMQQQMGAKTLLGG